MNILILGGGGREHALIKAMKSSGKKHVLACAPGNPGIAQDATCYLTAPTEVLKVLDLAKRLKPDVVVVGSEAPLAAGVADMLRQYEFKVFGPGRTAAQLESSKIYSKNFMLKNNIPTARSAVCCTVDELLAAKNQFHPPWVVKADGLAAGKGVRICHNEEELLKTAQDFFEVKKIGAAAEKVLIEEHIDGEEVSVLALVAGGQYQLLPFCQDHKRLKDNDEGPNTGGMGAIAPVSKWSKYTQKIKEKIIDPTLAGLKADRTDYRGVLYFGIMMKAGEPFLLEYNVRFGDPEAQVILPLLNGDWADVFLSVAKGEMPKLSWKKLFATCVVIAAPGYPDDPIKGAKINIDSKDFVPSPQQFILHAGTASHRGYYTNAGRVLNTVGVDKNLPASRKRAYDLVQHIQFENMYYRKDIGGAPLPPPKPKPEPLQGRAKYDMKNTVRGRGAAAALAKAKKSKPKSKAKGPAKKKKG